MRLDLLTQRWANQWSVMLADRGGSGLLPQVLTVLWLERRADTGPCTETKKSGPCCLAREYREFSGLGPERHLLYYLSRLSPDNSPPLTRAAGHVPICSRWRQVVRCGRPPRRP
jgi:hypothetical protein